MHTFPQPVHMSPRQEKFRLEYKNQISPIYNGLVHIGFIYVFGLLLIFYCSQHLENPTLDWLTIIPVAVTGNLIEWAMHKYVMHRLIDVFALRSIYDRHTRQHHQYFTDTDYTIDTTREFRIVFFPWRVLTVLVVTGTLFGYIASQLINANTGYILFMTMIAHYLIYETFHYCCHVQENWFVRNMPFINTIRRHHASHHNLGIMMHKNMNLTFPIFDWAMGSSDVKRSLLGTLFNGYDETHIDPKLKPIIEKFKSGKVQDEKVSLDGPVLTSEEAATLEK